MQTARILALVSISIIKSWSDAKWMAINQHHTRLWFSYGIIPSWLSMLSSTSLVTGRGHWRWCKETESLPPLKYHSYCCVQLLWLFGLHPLCGTMEKARIALTGLAYLIIGADRWKYMKWNIVWKISASVSWCACWGYFCQNHPILHSPDHAFIDLNLEVHFRLDADDPK